MYPQALQWHLELQSRQKMVEEFEKWWTIVQGNKKVIAEFEYKRLLDSSEIKNKQMFDK